MAKKALRVKTQAQESVETEEEAQEARRREAARITAAGEENMQRSDPARIGEYSGRYIELASGEEFGLKRVHDDPQGHTYHLSNKLHFHALSSADFKRLFEKK